MSPCLMPAALVPCVPILYPLALLLGPPPLVCSQCSDPADRRRIERLELFDELEEWHLIQQHYCIAIGVKDSAGLLGGFGLPRLPAGAGPPPTARQAG